jgi:hypothetical protein
MIHKLSINLFILGFREVIFGNYFSLNAAAWSLFLFAVIIGLMSIHFIIMQDFPVIFCPAAETSVCLRNVLSIYPYSLTFGSFYQISGIQNVSVPGTSNWSHVTFVRFHFSSLCICSVDFILS